ncbi:uncharacterized protein [Montipora foliosa]|uniref:uncharacterized protein n=1 Tax=Montipora foliosa TaxID=591990 RepID=UPI0035F18BD1
MQSNMPVFKGESTFTLTEGYDVENQRPYTSCACCGCLRRKRTFRVWQILLFLFVVIGIIALLCVLFVLFGRGNTEVKYRSPQRIVEDGGCGSVSTEISTTTTKEAEITPGVKKKTSTLAEASTASLPTTSPQTTSGQTTATSSSNSEPSTTSLPTTSPQTTSGQTTATSSSNSGPSTTSLPTTSPQTTSGQTTATSSSNSGPSTTSLTTTSQQTTSGQTTATSSSNSGPSTTSLPTTSPQTTSGQTTATSSSNSGPSTTSLPTTSQQTTSGQTTATSSSNSGPSTTSLPTTSQQTTSGQTTATSSSNSGPSTTSLTTTSQQTTSGQTTATSSSNSGPSTTSLTTTSQQTTSGQTTATSSSNSGPSTTSLPTTSQQTTSGQTTATSSSNSEPSTTSLPTTSPQTTSGQTTATPVIECGVAFVGGGTAGLLLARTLLKENLETNVCVFEKESHLGGKIFDYRFPEAQNITVGLGQLVLFGHNCDVECFLFDNLQVLYDPYERSIARVEDRGDFGDNFDALKPKASPMFSNVSVKQTAGNVIKANSSNFSTAGDFLSGVLSPKGAKFMEYVYGFNASYMQKINPESFKAYLQETLWDEDGRNEDLRPARGLSEGIVKLKKEVQTLRGKIYLSETVTSVDKDGSKFVLQTSTRKVKANKTVLTVGPSALKRITGDIIKNITDHKIFESIVTVPAFIGAAVYPSAWWEDKVAVKKNNSLKPLEMFVSHSNCSGITMPYRGPGPNGVAVLQTVANKGGCSDYWGNMLKKSKDNVDKEIKRALEYKFQRNIPVEPLNTTYKYWEDGFWYFQKPGAEFTRAEIRGWAKRPLRGNEVFLVGKAFYNFGGWLEDTILSAEETLKEGWNTSFVWLPKD